MYQFIKFDKKKHNIVYGNLKSIAFYTEESTILSALCTPIISIANGRVIQTDAIK